jgi:hypothetical protein
MLSLMLHSSPVVALPISISLPGPPVPVKFSIRDMSVAPRNDPIIRG